MARRVFGAGLLLVICLQLLPPSGSQFICHINQKGLRGNITFNFREDDRESATLVIESLLEADQFRWLLGSEGEDEFDGSQPILFDWSLHSNTLDPHMLGTCSDDDLGYPARQEIIKSIYKNKPMALDKTNRWDVSLSLDEAKNLRPMIWGKSIRLSLSQRHRDKVGLKRLPDVAATARPPELKSNQENERPTKLNHQRTSSAISRPKITLTSSTPSPGVPIKHTFAPRPKPSLSSKPKPTPAPLPSLPQPQALVADLGPDEKLVLETAVSNVTASSAPTTTTTAVSPSSSSSTSSPKLSRETILEATHKRIVKMYGDLVVCGNVIDTRNVKMAEANFDTQIGGKVTIRGNEDDNTLLMINLYHIRSKISTRHDWVIMASDILDNRREDEKCKYLQVVFNPDDIDDSQCKRNETRHCRMGDLTKKHGQIQVAGQGKSSRATLVDSNLPIGALAGSRSLFLVIYEVASKLSNNGLPVRPGILSCAPIKSVEPRKVEALFNMDGVRGTFRVTQRHHTEPALISYDLFGLEGNIKHQSIHELPLTPRSSSDNSKLCSNLGDLFDPNRAAASSHDNLMTTMDAFPVGNLSAKHGHLMVIDSEYEDHYMGEFADFTVQLFGHNSIVGRSLLIRKNNGEPWVCATLNYVDKPVTLAAVTFYYPAVGQISFQQVANEPFSETSVLVELYNPNGEKDSDGHSWLVHLKPALADFYNWSQRCESAGEVFDPIQASVGLSNEAYLRQCQASFASEQLRCKIGDTTLKSRHRISLSRSPQDRSRLFYTDLMLPLSGQHSIIGRSVVLYDENAPVQRGPRLACSNIKPVHALKASIRFWDSGPSIPSNVRGSAVFEQESPSKLTRIKMDLAGFSGNVEHYAIHDVWTMDDREFPCSNDSLYEIYDPYDSEHSLSLPPSSHYGSTATVDRVKVGDLSRKHGTLEGLQSVQKSFVDTNLPLFASRSIIGRSMVLRAAINDFRWVCGNIELDLDKGSSREIIALASFDDPRSKIAGYVRFYQLEHKDGSSSDTFLQIDLRLQNQAESGSGPMEPKSSEGHNWAVFVNQVGEDAYIAADDVRCIAAGFKWNPYLAQDTLDSYPLTSCTPGEQLACAIGDLGLRHGPLALGPNSRRSVSDMNLPLFGNYSVMGRSLVIFDNKRPSVKLACANIFPDIHLKSNVVVKRTPSFTVARFIEQMRSLLGASDWLMVPELRATKSVANGECVQMTIHFYGQRAHQIQVELNNLITLGAVRKSTRAGAEKVSTHYKLCRAGQAQLTSSTSSRVIDLSNSVQSLLVVLLICTATLAALTNLDPSRSHRAHILQRR